MTDAERLLALNRTLESARRCEFYRDRLPGKPLQSLEELRSLPLTTKDHLRAASPWGLLCLPMDQVAQYHETFGTTGTPVSSWFSQQDLEANSREIARPGGLNPGSGDVILIRFPYAISSAAHLFHEAFRQAGACVIPASSRSTVSPFTRVITMLARLRVTILAGLPLQALLLAETAGLMGMDPAKDFPKLRAICTAGEPLSPARRRLLSELWGVPVFNYYGLTEFGNVAVDCAEGRLHAAWDSFIVEVLQNDLVTPAEPGELGHLVITSLHRQASPVVRYVTGDRGRLLPGCPCGREHALEVRSRAQDLVTAAGRTFDQWDLEEMVSQLPFRKFWVAAPTDRGLHFVVEQEPGLGPVHPATVSALAARYGCEFAVDVVPTGTLYDRQELLAVAEVGKPKYLYTEAELRHGAHQRTVKL